MHEGAHGLITNSSKLNNSLSQWVCAFPVWSDTYGYRHYHLAHHRNTQLEDDPDLSLSKPFPVEKKSMLRKVLRDLYGILISNLIIFFIFWLLGQWWYYLAFWLLPLFTFFQLFLRIRNIAEHAGVKSENDFNNARTTYANIIERTFVAPYYVNYHLEHHLFMFVPCYKLKKAHEMILKKHSNEDLEIKSGYVSMLRSVLI